jgi:hypothetical protein
MSPLQTFRPTHAFNWNQSQAIGQHVVPQRQRASAIPVRLLRELLRALNQYRRDTVGLLLAGGTIPTRPEKDESGRPLPFRSLANVAGSRDSRLRRSGEPPATLRSDREWPVRSTEPRARV